jgi:hypothetical protein
MKLLSTILIYLLVSSTALASVGGRGKPLEWTPDIMTTPDQILKVIEAEAAYLSFETDEGRCGGEVLETALLKKKSYYTEDGNKVSLLKMRFVVTQSENYCSAESELVCEANFQVLSEEGIVMSEWLCE